MLIHHYILNQRYESKCDETWKQLNRLTLDNPGWHLRITGESKKTKYLFIV